MIDLEILRRKAKRGISFPKQTPQWVELFGVRCLAIGFYRGDERRILFIANKPTSGFHNAPSLFITHCFEFRCRWASQNEVDFIEPYGFYI